MITLSVSNFYECYSHPRRGNSYTSLSNSELIQKVIENWDKRTPGAGEGDRIDRKVLVPLSQPETPLFFCPPSVTLQIGMPIQAQVVQRQEGEDPYIKTFISPDDALEWGFQPIPAKSIQVVCYSAEALLENNGKRSSESDWEIVTLLCSLNEQEPMTPLTMARNFLEMPGGTKGEYTAREFAESIYYHSRRRISVCELE